MKLEQWTKQLKACRRSEVLNPVGTILFCKNAENAVKVNISPRFTGFTAKRCKKYAVKIIFVHRICYENSPPNLDPGRSCLHIKLFEALIPICGHLACVHEIYFVASSASSFTLLLFRWCTSLSFFQGE